MLEKVSNDIEGVVLAHELGVNARAGLIRIITGTITGNRDRALFMLVGKISRWLDSEPQGFDDGRGLVFYILAMQPHSSPAFTICDTALLDFLVSMDGFCHADDICAAFNLLVDDPTNGALIKECTNGLQRQLYKYRRQYLPREKRRQQFAELTRFLRGRDREGDRYLTLEDGMALKFWCEHASTRSWTLYQTVFTAMQALKQAQDMELAANDVKPLESPSRDEYELPDMWDQVEHSIELSGDLREILATALANILSCSVKIFKKTEIEALEQIIRLERFGISWVRSSACLLALFPHQASLVQLKRDNAEKTRIQERTDCSNGDDYGDLLDRLARLHNLLNEVRSLRFVLTNKDDVHQSAPELSMMVDSFNRRNCALLRRKEIRNMPDREFSTVLVQIYDDIKILANHLERLLAGWTRLFADNPDRAFLEDKKLFSDKLKTLYGAGDG